MSEKSHILEKLLEKVVSLFRTMITNKEVKELFSFLIPDYIYILQEVQNWLDLDNGIRHKIKRNESEIT